jgi:hypothetical protein
LLLRHRAVGWVYAFLVQLCCCDVVCWLQTIPGIVEAGTMFRYLKKLVANPAAVDWSCNL